MMHWIEADSFLDRLTTSFQAFQPDVAPEADAPPEADDEED